MIKTIIFDLDGTIIDSEPLAFQAVLDLAKHWKLQIGKADAAIVAGKKWEVVWDLLYQKYDMPVPKEKASELILTRYKVLLEEKLQVVPGVVEAIEDFSKHFRLALVSGSYRAEIEWALTKLNLQQYFELVLGAEDYPASKPAPDGYLKALSLLQTEPKEALIFEDSRSGIASAKAAGVPVIAITSTNHFAHDLSAADEKIADFQNITAEWVKKLKF